MPSGWHRLSRLPPEGHPPGLPKLFIDRSLGRLEVPRLLRDAGLDLVTLAEHYGMPADEDVEDVTWIADVARHGWVALMKDARIRRRPAERAAIQSNGTRCFCVPRADLPSAVMGERYLANLGAMTTACQSPGPFLYAVHAHQLRAMPL